MALSLPAAYGCSSPLTIDILNRLVGCNDSDGLCYTSEPRPEPFRIQLLQLKWVRGPDFQASSRQWDPTAACEQRCWRGPRSRHPQNGAAVDGSGFGSCPAGVTS